MRKPWAPAAAARFSSGRFSEVVVDHQTSAVAETEAITEGEDLSAAKAQSAAISKAKSSLADAVGRATAANAGYVAVSAVPKLGGGHPVADVILVKGQQWKTATEPLE